MSAPSSLTSDNSGNMNNGTGNGNSNGVPSQRRGRSSEDGGTTTATDNSNSSSNDDDRLSRHTTLLEGLERRTRLVRQLLRPLVLFLALLLRIALWPLRTLSKIVFPSSEFDDAHSTAAADRAAVAFSQHFRHKYLAPGTENGDENDNSDSFQFSNKGYQSTLSSLVSAASSSSTSTNSPLLLLVYLHSPLHRDADTFAAQTLCDPTVMAFLTAECHPTSGLIRAFGASVHTADGVAAASSLQVGCYPHLSLLSCRGSSSSSSRRSSATGNSTSTTAISAEVLLRLEGETLLQTKPGPLVAYLQAAVQKFREVRTQQLAAQRQREEAQRLRTEQDYEYQRALEADRAREEQRRQEEAAAREAERKAQEEADRAAEEEANKLQRAKDLAGGPEPTEGPLAKVRFTLPSGERIVRTFRATDTVAVIRAFLILHFHGKEIPIVNFSLSTNFPKRVLEEDSPQTLQEMGLCPQAVVMIQDLDA